MRVESKHTDYGGLSDVAVQQHRRLVSAILARSGLSGESDDLIQEGMIGLMDALVRYDPTMGTQFSTYAHPWIRKRMIDCAYDRALIRLPKHARKTCSIPPMVSLDSLRNEPSVETISGIEDRLDLQRLLLHLTAGQRKAVILTQLWGYTNREAGRRMGITGERVGQLVQAAMVRLRLLALGELANRERLLGGNDEQHAPEDYCRLAEYVHSARGHTGGRTRS